MARRRKGREAPVLVPLAREAREMIVSRDPYETRIAFVEDGRLAEFYFERQSESSVVGNIYRGRVTNVLPGLQAAFVDIGLEKSGFLHVRDVMTESITIEDFMNAKREAKHEEGLSEEDAAAMETARRPAGRETAGRGRRPIQDLLRKGQEIMVQVEKASISTKGPRLTGQISLPSRLVVLIPGAKHTGVSHRIVNEKERSRLKKILDQITPKGFGVIARTSAEGATIEELKPEVLYLTKLWRQVKASEKKHKAPAVLHGEQGLLHRVARDLLTREDRRIVIDGGPDSKEMKHWLSSFLASLKPEIEVYQGEVPLFESLNLESEIDKAQRPKVWLKCGGYLVIEETEALVVVDVNTGRHVGKGQQDETILKTNLEAAQEIGRQLRLRDLGGIIVLDFIDMRIAEHKERVYQELSKALRRDRSKTNIRKLTDLGLIEMTRKRVRGSLLRTLNEPCPMCQGRGWVTSRDTMQLRLRRMLDKAKRLTEENLFVLEVSPHWLLHTGEAFLREQARQAKCKVTVAARDDLKTDEVRVISSITQLVVVGGDKE